MEPSISSISSTPREILQEGKRKLERTPSLQFSAVGEDLEAGLFLMRAMQKLFKRSGVLPLNSGPSHENMLRIYDLAIDLAKEEEEREIGDFELARAAFNRQVRQTQQTLLQQPQQKETA